MSDVIIRNATIDDIQKMDDVCNLVFQDIIPIYKGIIAVLDNKK
jgi:hypothetical protein